INLAFAVSAGVGRGTGEKLNLIRGAWRAVDRSEYGRGAFGRDGRGENGKVLQIVRTGRLSQMDVRRNAQFQVRDQSGDDRQQVNAGRAEKGRERRAGDLQKADAERPVGIDRVAADEVARAYQIDRKVRGLLEGRDDHPCSSAVRGRRLAVERDRV